MKRCQNFEPLLIEKLYGELDAHHEQELNLHLRECAACQKTLAELQSVLHSLGKLETPQMPEHFWTGYWDRLRTRVANAPQAEEDWVAKLRARFALRWTLAFRLAAAAALVLLGVFIGRFLQPQGSPGTEPQAMRAYNIEEATAISQRTAQVLDRSKILLLGVVNEDFSATSAADLTRQRKLSRELLTEVRSLQTVLPNSPDRRLLQLVQQLELVLIQIAALEAEHDLTGVDLVRDGIAREGLLLKINIEELNRKAQTEKPLAKPPKTIL